MRRGGPDSESAVCNLNEETGFLVEASLFLGEAGEPVIPGGQILIPIGGGMEPIDSLAEYMRVHFARTTVVRSNKLNDRLDKPTRPGSVSEEKEKHGGGIL
jgi:hypothetical protein